MMQRKNKPAAPKASATTSHLHTSTPTSSNNVPILPSSSSNPSSSSPPPQMLVATAYRRKCGTSPFDDSWLNLDCCGLFCAFLTYMLHLYGCYAVCSILIPPWMSYVGVDGVRKISIWGRMHCIAFTFIAFMAIFSHYRAMTTDPGAVPPDAVPLPNPTEPTTKNDSSEPTTIEDGTFNGKPNQDVGSSPLYSRPNSDTNNHSNNNINNGALPSVAMAAAGAVVGVTGAVASSALPLKPPVMVTAKGKRICRRCNAYKPQRAHHCSICRRCIIKMDHHCPWVNNCVGIGNHKFFLLFILYTFFSCTYSSTLLVWRCLMCVMKSHEMEGSCLGEPTDLLYLIGLMVEAMLFGLFTSCMMVDQWDVVMSNVTHIDRLKNENHNIITFDDDHHHLLTKKKQSAGINEVFGVDCKKRNSTNFHCNWLSPFVNAAFPASVRDEIMGFCRPCIGNGVGADEEDGNLEMKVVKRAVVEIV